MRMKTQALLRRRMLWHRCWTSAAWWCGVVSSWGRQRGREASSLNLMMKKVGEEEAQGLACLLAGCTRLSSVRICVCVLRKCEP